MFIKKILTEDTVLEPYRTYFKKAAEFIVMLDKLYGLVKEEELNNFSMEQLKGLNDELYSEIYKENYKENYYQE